MTFDLASFFSILILLVSALMIVLAVVTYVAYKIRERSRTGVRDQTQDAPFFQRYMPR